MNEGVSGWYGLLLIVAIVGFLATIGSVLGLAAMRLMLKDETYYPEEG